MIIDGSIQKSNLKETFDVLIVGSGAGGAVLAKELAQGGLKVAILEEGNYWKTSDHKDLPAQAVGRMYRNKGFTTSIGSPIIPIPMGRALGGTTVINSGTCFRTPEKVFESWRSELQLSELSFKQFDGYFTEIEKNIHVQESDFKVMSKANTLFHDLLSHRGTPGKALRRNIKNCDGCGFCCYGCPTGAKQSMEQNYLPMAFKLGATAFINTRAERLIIKGNKIIGVKANFQTINARKTGFTLKIMAKKVVLACGAILTPGFLQQNGVATNNSNLGAHLTIHPTVKIFAEYDDDIFGWEGTPQAYYFDILKNQGIMFEGIFVPPDIYAMSLPFIGKAFNEFMLKYKKMAAFGFLISDSSFGKVRNLPLFGSTPFYSLTSQDIEKIKNGILFLAELFFEGGAKAIYTMIHGFAKIGSRDDLKKFSQANLKPTDYDGLAFHPLGSCRMGVNQKSGVIDSQYRVYGYEGLYICDGSVVPTALGVNPQMTIMAFAMDCASKMLA